ncbi:hypothetical protein AGMMS49525_09610 [Bacteroidia bacterium]|nr:hypothetical protein AGMMS49525_09610 [Bacteroidia bacterium]
MKKVLILAAITVMAGVLFASCGSSKNAAPLSVTDKAIQKQAGIPVEVEVTFPCEGLDSNEEFLRVNGNGTSKDRTMAKDRAYQSALANLSSKLAGVASMENQRVGVSTNADGEEFHDKMIAVSKVIAQANVSGYRTACEKYTVKPDASYTCYVTIEFGNQKVVKQLYEKLNNDKLLKADYDFDKYSKQFNEDLKEYEQKNK